MYSPRNFIAQMLLSLWKRKIAFLIILSLSTFLVLFSLYSHFNIIPEQQRLHSHETNIRHVAPQPPLNPISNGASSEQIIPQPAKILPEWRDNGILRPTTSSAFVPDLRIVHLDLKGAPPSLEYLEKFFDLIADAGANGVLLEYEDMFPYLGNIAEIAATNHYSLDQIQKIVQLCIKHKFELIPLVQTFGHLEFALKLHKFRHLREIDTYPTAVCPKNEQSFTTLIRPIIEQVVSVHREAGYNLRYLHIGSDEVFHIGACNRCQTHEKENLFTEHVSKVASFVRNELHLTPIIWDDMLRNLGSDNIAQLGKLVEPMVWTYIKDIYRFIPFGTWRMFSDAFSAVWGASAFKGAFGETLIVPDANMHLENNVAWLETLREQKQSFKHIRGLVLTGWQRYDHLAVLCELLPSGTPSLILSLITVTQGEFNARTVFKRFDQVLKCRAHSVYQTHLERNGVVSSSNAEGFSYLGNDIHLYNRAAACSFPGVQMFRFTQTLNDLIKRVNDYLYDVTIHKAWLTKFNMRHNYSNPARIEESLTESSALLSQLKFAMLDVHGHLSKLFDQHTVYEWIEQNIYPYVEQLENVRKEAHRVSLVREWQQRPLTALADLKRLGLPTPP